MLVYAIILNQSHPATDIGFQTCLGLYNDYDIAHAEWKKLMRDPPSGDVNGLYWTAWLLEEEVLDGLDNELRIAEWCPSPDAHMDGTVKYTKAALEKHFDQNVDRNVVWTIWIGVASFVEIHPDTKQVMCNHVEIITTGPSREFVEAAIEDCSLASVCQLQSYYTKEVQLNSKPEL
jgi:hypothetical protein